MATRVVEHTNIWKLNTGAWNKKVSEKKTVNIEVFYMIDSFDLLARRACHSFTIPRFKACLQAGRVTLVQGLP